MADHTTTETIAALMARGYNRHIKDHGPDGSYASEVHESRDGHAVLVEREGAKFAVHVERLPAVNTDAPKTPGQHWTDLRRKLAQDIAIEQELGDDQAECGDDDAENRAYRHWGKAEALREVLAWMDREEGRPMTTTLDTGDPKAYIAAHDKRAVRLDRLAVAHLNTIYSDALGNTLVYTGPMDRDELVNAILAAEFPEIGAAREAYAQSVAGV